MSKANNSFLRQLTVQPLAAARPSYGDAGACTYRAVKTDAQGRHSDRQLDISIRSTRDRLLIRLADGATPSTALITSDGEMVDFNLAGPGQFANADTFATLATKRAAALKAEYGADGHVINELTLYFPHFSGALTPGQDVSTIKDENQQIWGRYVYRGKAEYDGRQVYVLDLLRQSEATPKQGERTIGFALIDAAKMMPMLVVLESIQKIQLRQLRCA
jgi:hypothetical protein